MTSVPAMRVISAVVNSPKFLSRFAVLLLALSFAGCATPEKPKLETAPQFVAQNEEIRAATKVPAPEVTEVQEAVKRVFKDSVEIDSSRTTIFIDGDFNGDSSRDLAVVIKPAPNKLADLNEGFPNWILKDPFSGAVPHVPRLRVTADETLLAVIHGYGEKGWRDSQATQTFLLKDSVGSGMRPYQAKDLTKAHKSKKTPYLRGDVIGQIIDGASGYLYFAGATYSWYEPNTFHPKTETGMAHLRSRKNTR